MDIFEGGAVFYEIFIVCRASSAKWIANPVESDNETLKMLGRALWQNLICIRVLLYIKIEQGASQICKSVYFKNRWKLKCYAS